METKMFIFSNGLQGDELVEELYEDARIAEIECTIGDSVLIELYADCDLEQFCKDYCGNLVEYCE